MLADATAAPATDINTTIILFTNEFSPLPTRDMLSSPGGDL